MGNCLATASNSASKRVQSSDDHLLGQQAGAHTAKQQHHAQHLTDSEPNEFQYREIEHSMTHNSNLNAIVPSSNNSLNSSPKHRPIIYGGSHLATSNSSHHHHEHVQRQIEILKQCSNDEIKMLKSRIQTLEQHIDRLEHANTVVHTHDCGECKQSTTTTTHSISVLQCTKNTPMASCPNLQRVVSVSKSYTQLLASAADDKHLTHNELDTLRTLQREHSNFSTHQLLTDYAHILEIHCSRNNLFELRMVYLDVADMLQSCQCAQSHVSCRAVVHVSAHSFVANLHYLLSLVHCYLYHSYEQSEHDQLAMQRLRDVILDRNDNLMRFYQPQHLQLQSDLKIYDGDDANSNAMMLNTQQNKSRHDSVHSVVSNQSNVTNNSASKASQSVSRDDSNISALSQSAPIKTKNKNAAVTVAIEMSEERVRRLSGSQMSERQLRQLIDAYDREQPNDDIDGDAGNVDLIQPLSLSDSDRTTHQEEEEEEENQHEILESASDELDEQEREQIEEFKSKLKQQQQQPRRGSKHNLIALQHRDEWDVKMLKQTAQDMKMQLLHLALNSKSEQV